LPSRAFSEEGGSTPTTLLTREMDMRFWLEQAEAGMGPPQEFTLNRAEPAYVAVTGARGEAIADRWR